MGEIIHIHILDEVSLGVVHETAYRVDLLQNQKLRPVGRLDRARYVLMDALVVRQRVNG